MYNAPLEFINLFKQSEFRLRDKIFFNCTLQITLRCLGRVTCNRGGVIAN